MTEVDHEVGAIKFLVEAPLSSRVAMFNQKAENHMSNQLLNPFSEVDGNRPRSPRQFGKGEYGRPLAGSLTEQRGQKANIHVFHEMRDLCEIINQNGGPMDENEPNGKKYIFFGELFNIYVHISDKVVGLLLRARKHKLVDFEGEILFQRRDDDVPIMMLKTMQEIRDYLHSKEDDVRRSVSPNPQAK